MQIKFLTLIGLSALAVAAPVAEVEKEASILDLETRGLFSKKTYYCPRGRRSGCTSTPPPPPPPGNGNGGGIGNGNGNGPPGTGGNGNGNGNGNGGNGGNGNGVGNGGSDVYQGCTTLGLLNVLQLCDIFNGNVINVPITISILSPILNG